MPFTEEFARSPHRFAAKKVIIVNETGIAKPAAGVGQHQVLIGQNYIFDWTMGSQPALGNMAELTVHAPPHQPGRRTAYFLPWEAGAAIAMDIPPGPGVDFFFTSTLSGCLVEVELSSLGVLRVTHANARPTYRQFYEPAQQDNDIEGIRLRQADRRAKTEAIAEINSMLPVRSQGSTYRRVNAFDYAAKVTDDNVKQAQRLVEVGERERVKQLVAVRDKGAGLDEMHRGGKHEVGAFVYGVRDNTTGWSFWYQTSVKVLGMLERGMIHKKNRRLPPTEVVVGRPERFYP